MELRGTGWKTNQFRPSNACCGVSFLVAKEMKFGVQNDRPRQAETVYVINVKYIVNVKVLGPSLFVLC